MSLVCHPVLPFVLSVAVLDAFDKLTNIPIYYFSWFIPVLYCTSAMHFVILPRPFVQVVLAFLFSSSIDYVVGKVALEIAIFAENVLTVAISQPISVVAPELCAIRVLLYS